MTKKEQLKIYSAYLPYELNIIGIHSKQLGNDSSNLTKVEEQHLLSGLTNGYAQFDNSIFGNPIELIKPILYPLSYLTQEIEHEGKSFIPIDVLKQMNIGAEIFSNEGFLYHTLDLPYKCVEKLLEWHFNVFNVSEDQFINKATLKTK